jgi:hypothetical protein
VVGDGEGGSEAPPDGRRDGKLEGANVAPVTVGGKDCVGPEVGKRDGASVPTVGPTEPVGVGPAVGADVGIAVGIDVVLIVARIVGFRVGSGVGSGVG